MGTAPIRVMLVDDDELILKQVGDALYAAGHEVQLCQYPTLALPTAQSFRPDVLVLDLNMPVLNGFEVARSVRRDPNLTNSVVIFLTSQNTNPRDDVRGLLAGASDIWRKPFGDAHLERLIDLLYARKAWSPNETENLRERTMGFFRRERYTGFVAVNPGTPFEGRAELRKGEIVSCRLGPLENADALDEMLAQEYGAWRFELSGAGWQSPAVSVPVAPGGYKPSVLLVDDDSDIRKLAALQLQRAGFTVATAEDGDEGHRRARRGEFDVVVADLNMPVLDGWGMLKLLKTEPLSRETPVLVLSAHDDYRETLKAARAGAQDYLPKTGHADDLVTHVRRLAAPRQILHQALLDRQSIEGVELSLLGTVWLLRTLGELEASYTLHAVDDWGRYSLAVQRGRLLKASASSGPRSASGALALVSLIVSRAARAVLAPIGGLEDEGRPLLLDALTEAIDRVSQLERKVMEERLAAAAFAPADTEIYDLYLRVASTRDAQLARALCEEKVPPSQLATHLGFPEDEVRASLVEMLRRGVISLA
jgi:DNA-binding response OmpR family regulator